MYLRPQGNIVKVEAVDLAANGDYEDPKGFFVRVETEGYLRTWPLLNEDAHPIDKTYEASFIFIDPELIRKISILNITPGCEASDIYIGKGL